MSNSLVMYPSITILSHWSDQDWDRAVGVQIDARERLDCLLVRTHHNVYEVIVQSGMQGEVLVRGGRFFPTFTRGHLAGSSLGGSVLKRLGIYIGLRMEFVINSKTIITSPVTSISFCPLDDDRPGCQTAH